jgi:hypothetical protein
MIAPLATLPTVRALAGHEAEVAHQFALGVRSAASRRSPHTARPRPSAPTASRPRTLRSRYPGCHGARSTRQSRQSATTSLVRSDSRRNTHLARLLINRHRDHLGHVHIQPSPAAHPTQPSCTSNPAQLRIFSMIGAATIAVGAQAAPGRSARAPHALAPHALVPTLTPPTATAELETQGSNYLTLGGLGGRRVSVYLCRRGLVVSVG